LGLIFISSLIEKKFPSLSVYLEHVYLGTAVTAFMLSLKLPTVLMNIQLSKHDEIIDSRRKKSGLG